jgi:3-oxoacyl-[acyl-carrier protein] reductase
MPTLFLTGAAGALAASIAEHYLAMGWQVAGFDRVSDKIYDSYKTYRSYTLDAMNEASVTEAFAKANAEQGTPRALIATVGGIKPWANIEDVTQADFEFLLGLNLTSFFLAAKCALLSMKAAGAGSVISIGAEAALNPEAKKSGYAASKAGVVALTKVIAEEGKEYGVNANCIVPTVIRTEANLSWGEPDEIPKWTDPKDIAEACFFLTSDAGRSVNGTVLRMPNRM